MISETPHRTAAPAVSDARDPHLPRALTDEEFRLFSEAGQARVVLPGEVLFRKDEYGLSLYVIESGTVRLDFGDGLADKLLGPRQYFGELAVFVGEHARFASASAEGEGRLYELDQPAFDALLAREPWLMARFMRRSFAYLVASEGQLVQNLRRRNEDLLQTLDALRRTRSELSVTQQLVRTDELTGLANRRGLYAYLDELGRQRLPELQLALLLVDIDGFKQINDRCGHLAGDSALRAVAEEVRQQAGPLELPCRLGGDEFALVARVADAGDLANRAIGLVSAVRSLRLPGLREHRLSISVGAGYCSDSAGWSAWYSAADAALYQAKGRGGDGWRLVG